MGARDEVTSTRIDFDITDTANHLASRQESATVLALVLILEERLDKLSRKRPDQIDQIGRYNGC